MSGQRYILTLSERQAVIVQNALDVYSRLQIGQWRAAFELLPLDDKRPGFSWTDWHDLLGEIGKSISAFTVNHVDGWFSSLGIHNTKADESSRIAWDIRQVIRHRLSWDRAVRSGVVESLDSRRNWPEMMGVNYDEPTQTGEEPLPTIGREVLS